MHKDYRWTEASEIKTGQDIVNRYDALISRGEQLPHLNGNQPQAMDDFMYMLRRKLAEAEKPTPDSSRGGVVHTVNSAGDQTFSFS
jgi:hypothetical protein